MGKAVQYIPQLGVYYDEERDIYIDEHGNFISPEHMKSSSLSLKKAKDLEKQEAVNEEVKDDSPKDNKFSLSNLKVSITTVVQVITFTAAVMGQYSALQNGISDNATQLTLYKTITDEKIAEIATLKTELKSVRAEVAITTDALTALQIRLASRK